MTHAVIIGGGIAGPVAALALQQAGISATIYESYATGADDVGAFLTVAVNGLDALRAVDADQPVADQSFPATNIEINNARGRTLGRVELGSDTDTGPRTLTRAGLYRVLHDEAAVRDIGLEHGKHLTRIDTTDHGVTASFADGTRARGDLLIGADGVHSTVRTIIDPAAPLPRALGWHTVCGYSPNTAPHPNTSFRMIYGKRALFAHIAAPGGDTWWAANVPGTLTADEIAETTKQQWKQRLTTRFARDHTPAAEIVAAADSIVATNTYDIPTTPTWHNETMVVIGDAAHAAAPPTAQGASLAIEDAVILAKSLRDIPGQADAFATYEHLRRERVERVVAMGANRMGTLPNRWKRIIRDRNLARALRRPSPTSSWLRGHHIDWNRPTQC